MAGHYTYVPDCEEVKLGGVIHLGRSESHHLVSVLRVRQGDAVVAFNGVGGAWGCRVEVADGKSAQLVVDEMLSVNRAGVGLVLVQAVAKGGVMEGVVQKAAEIGVEAVYPVMTERVEVKLDAERRKKKVDKWRMVAVEACKQSGNLVVPQVYDIQQFEEFFRTYSDTYSQGVGYVASLEADAAKLTIEGGGEGVGSVVLAVGPEGDFTENEYGKLREAGFVGLRLARNVLRVETAVVYGLSVLDAGYR